MRGLFIESARRRERPRWSRSSRALGMSTERTPATLGAGHARRVHAASDGPGPSVAPDLVLVRTDTKEAVAAFEWKVGANGNRTFRATLDRLPRAHGKAATAIHAANDGDPGRSRKTGRDDLDHDAEPQLDAYLGWQWWSTKDTSPSTRTTCSGCTSTFEGRRPGTGRRRPGQHGLVGAARSAAPRARPLPREHPVRGPRGPGCVAVLGWSLWARGRVISKVVRETETPEQWVEEFDEKVSAESPS